MPVKTFNTRIKNKMDSIANLTPQSGAMVPLAGEIVIGYPSTASNTNAAPFMLKVGDGTTQWSNLPPICTPMIVGTESFTSSRTQTSGVYTEKLTVKFSADSKNYARYKFNDSNADDNASKLVIAVTGGNYVRTEHYVLLDNSDSAIEKLFSGITIDGISNSNLLVQEEYLSAGDTMELKISFYDIGGTKYAFITSKPSAANGGGDTVAGKTVTLSTYGRSVIQVNGSDSGSVSLPSTITVGGTNMPEIAIGTTTTTQQVSIGSGDRLVITDNSASNNLRATSISFGSSTSTFLRNDGQWATPSGGGGGGGSTVTLPSGYSESTGITLNSSTLSTVATVDGVNLNLMAPASSFSDGIGIETTGVNTINAVVAKCETKGTALVPKHSEYILPVLSPGQSPAGPTVSKSQYSNWDPDFGDDITGTWPNNEILGDQEQTAPNYLYVSLPTALSVFLSKLWGASELHGVPIAGIIDSIVGTACSDLIP